MQYIRLRSALVCALLLAALSAWAQNYTHLSDVQLYGNGRDRVGQGRDLEQAISQLSALVKRKPDDADYRMMLGCACVSRLASLHYAAEDTKMVESAQLGYQRRLKIWRQMQDDSTLPLFGRPQPTAPGEPSTPDDRQAYDPLSPLAQQRVTDLSKQALHSFREALRLGRSLPPKHKIEIDYNCGWGMLLLYRSAKESIHFQELPPPASKADKEASPAPTPPDELLLKQAEIIACFQECADTQSKNADYWQSLAFAYAPDYLTDNAGVHTRDQVNEKTDRVEEAIKSLKHALALPGKRVDPDLLYQNALFASLSASEKAVESLEKLTAAQTTNAVNFYLLAEACFAQAAKQAGMKASQTRLDALTAIENGNKTLQYFNATLLLPVPKPLASAWNYRRTYGLGLDASCLETLYFSLREMAEDPKQQKEEAFLRRCDVCMMEMGLNCLHHYEGADLDPGDMRTQNIAHLRGFCGMLSCNRAYRLMKSAAEKSSDPDTISLANAYAPSEAYFLAWDKALTEK